MVYGVSATGLPESALPPTPPGLAATETQGSPVDPWAGAAQDPWAAAAQPAAQPMAVTQGDAAA